MLISLFSTNTPLSYAASTTAKDNNERTRGGERDTKADFISERTMDILLREMRKMDRDRDRVLHPVQIKTLFSKYKVAKIIYVFLNAFLKKCNLLVSIMNTSTNDLFFRFQ